MADLGRLKIGDFVLDPARNLLVGAGGETKTTLEPKIVDVLLALAAKPGAVMSRDALIDAVWKMEFGADERLTRTISQLRKALGDDRGTPRYIETVSKRGYRLVAVVAPACDAADAVAANGASHSAAAEAVAAPAPVAEPADPTPVRRWRAWQAYAAAGAVATIAIAGAAASIWRDPDERVSAHRMDVVELRPFVVIDGSEGLDTFARQAHASLKRILASNQVSVVDGGAAAYPTAGEGAEFVLSGVVEKSGGDYAVTVYFDNAKDGQTLWSSRLARPLAEADAMREAVGANAANTIGCSLKQRAKAPRKPGIQAFTIYLELCDWKIWDDIGEEVLATAERLVAVAPDDAYGHGLVAIVNSLMAADRPHVAPAVQIDFYTGAARKAAARALVLDPKNDDALLALALLGSRANYWLALDAFEVRQGGSYVVVLRDSGRLKESINVLDRTVASKPLSLGARAFRAALYMQAGYHEVAERMLADVLQLLPDHRAARFYRFVNTAFYGHPERALALLKDDGDFLAFEVAYRSCWRAFLEARDQPADRRREVAAVRAACDEIYRTIDESNRDYIRRMLAALGDVDGVFELMQTKSWAWRGSTVPLWYPEMAVVRRDARFMPLIVPSGLPEYWLKSENWPDFCRNDALPYDCESAAAQALKNGVAVTSGP